jgi:hypothetical protein
LGSRQSSLGILQGGQWYTIDYFACPWVEDIATLSIRSFNPLAVD